MAEASDVVITSRVPVGNDWMVSGYATMTADTFVGKGQLGFRTAVHAVYVNGQSQTVTENNTSVVLNSNNGTEDSSPGDVWFTNGTTLVCDFCVIGR